MRLFLLCLGLSILGVVALTACNSAEFKNAKTSPSAPAGPAAPASDGARRVTVAELKGLLDSGEAVVIDVRNQSSYDAGHIPGSTLIPEGEILNHISELPTNKLIVTYCS